MIPSKYVNVTHQNIKTLRNDAKRTLHVSGGISICKIEPPWTQNLYNLDPEFKFHVITEKSLDPESSNC